MIKQYEITHNETPSEEDIKSICNELSHCLATKIENPVEVSALDLMQIFAISDIVPVRAENATTFNFDDSYGALLAVHRQDLSDGIS